MNLLDTSLIIDFLRGKTIHEELIKHAGDDRGSISAFTVHELLQGANQKQQFIILHLLEGLDIYSYDEKTAQISSEIKRKLQTRGETIGIIDIFIAAVAMQHDATLVTLDKDFEKIAGLNVQVF